MIFTLTKTTCSQRGELFAKSDFHESIRLNAKVLYLRNSESCNLSRSVHLARRAMYTERSLRAATRFLQQISKKSKRKSGGHFKSNFPIEAFAGPLTFGGFPFFFKRKTGKIQLKILNKFNSKSLVLMKVLNMLLHFNLQKHII